MVWKWRRVGARGLRSKNGERMVVHRPHPHPETSRATVRDIAMFLQAAGVELDDQQE